MSLCIPVSFFIGNYASIADLLKPRNIIATFSPCQWYPHLSAHGEICLIMLLYLTNRWKWGLKKETPIYICESGSLDDVAEIIRYFLDTKYA